MAVSFETLLNSKIKWTPQHIPRSPLEVDTPEATAMIDRILAMGLYLEMPVGAFVGQATKRDLPIPAIALKLLLSNISDETIHFQAISKASVVYPVSEKSRLDAQAIAKEWDVASSHPLEKAALIEIGSFMVALAVLYFVGGDSLANLGFDIARDEIRHVAAHRAILRMIGLTPDNPPESIMNLRKQTVDWMIGDFTHPDLWLNKDWFLEQSLLLVTTGQSKELNELTGGSLYKPPFESSNRRLY